MYRVFHNQNELLDFSKSFCNLLITKFNMEKLDYGNSSVRIEYKYLQVAT